MWCLERWYLCGSEPGHILISHFPINTGPQAQSGRIINVAGLASCNAASAKKFLHLRIIRQMYSSYLNQIGHIREYIPNLGKN